MRIALAIWLPYLVWQGTHGWPQLELAEDIRRDEGSESRAGLVPLQLLLVGPLLVPVLAVGLWGLVRDPRMRPWRALGFAYVALLVLTFATAGKPYYTAPFLLCLLAAGSPAVERWLTSQSRRALLAAALAVSAALSIVIALPVVPAEPARVDTDRRSQRGRDRDRWLAGARRHSCGGVRSLPPAQRATAVVFTGNYGEAGAIDRYGPALGLPRAHSAHNAYARFGVPPGRRRAGRRSRIRGSVDRLRGLPCRGDDRQRRRAGERGAGRNRVPLHESAQAVARVVAAAPTPRRVGRRRSGHTPCVIQAAIQTLLDGHDLTRDDAREVMGEIMGGEATPAQISGFLVALRAKGETADEIAGCAEAMRAHVLPVRTAREDVVDVVGTGGDGARTFNISTTAAIVAAAAGAAVAKHGNRAVSSLSGSADVLEALGFALEQTPERIAESIDTLGFGFMFAPLHHPAMRHAAPVRRELGTRTIFNVLGPLTNPAGARAGVFGVYGPEVARTVADALAVLDSRRAFVVHGAYGVDELSPAGPNLVFEVAEGAVRERIVDPLELGLERCEPAELAGGSPEDNARTTREVFAGARGAKHDAVVLNAAGAIAAGGHATISGRVSRSPRRRSRAAARPHGWRSSPRSRNNPPDGTLRRRSSPAWADGDRGGQAALAVRGRPPARCRSGRAGRSLRTRRRSCGVDPRRRTLRRHLGRPASSAGVCVAAAPREGLLQDGGGPADGTRSGRGRSAAPAARPRRPDSAAAPGVATELGLETLVEAHDAEELERAVALGAPVIGVNARDLATFEIDRVAQLRLVADAPRDRVVVAESGIESRAQGAAAELAGADAILVGSTLMRAADPAAKLAELVSRPLVKVCGLTREEDVAVAVEAGADMAGFVLADASPRRAPGILPVPATMLSVAVVVGEAEGDADLVQLYPPEEGKVRGRDAVLLRDGEEVARVLDLPWQEEDPSISSARAVSTDA